MEELCLPGLAADGALMTDDVGELVQPYVTSKAVVHNREGLESMHRAFGVRMGREEAEVTNVGSDIQSYPGGRCELPETFSSFRFMPCPSSPVHGTRDLVVPPGPHLQDTAVRKGSLEQADTREVTGEGP